ncbi:MAG: inositol phosphorylceramide synthase [Chloroflexi bacterium]|nr:inositol phosphorylceramide synthase [Chloroflexota bacterium]
MNRVARSTCQVNLYQTLLADLGIMALLAFLQAEGFWTFGLNYPILILNAIALGGWVAFAVPRACLSARAFFYLLLLHAVSVLLLTNVILVFKLNPHFRDVLHLLPGPFGWRYWTVFALHYLLAALWMWDILARRLYGQGFPRPEAPPKTQDQVLFSMQIVVIIAFSLLVTFYNHLFPSLDFLSFLLVFILGLHRYYRTFLLDFAPVVFILLTYETMRAFADNLSPSQIHVDDVIAMERALFRGAIPSAVLQRWLPWDTALGQALHLTSLIFYSSHFVLPFVLSLWLWRRRPRLFYPFVTGIVLLSLAGFVTYLLFPAAPPWWATYFGHLRGAQAVQSDPPPRLMLTAPNPVAAMPSLHMAYPTFQALFVTFVLGKKGWWIWIFPLGVGFAILYLGHHYFVDLLAGIAYASAIFLVLYPWLRRRKAAQTS